MTTEVRHGDPWEPQWKESEEAMQFSMDRTKPMYLAPIGRGDDTTNELQFQMTTEVRHVDPWEPRWKESEEAMQFSMDRTKPMYLALIGRGDDTSNESQFQMTTEVCHGDPWEPQWKESEEGMQFNMDRTKTMYLALIGRGDDTRMIGFCKLDLEDMLNKLELKPKEKRPHSLSIYSAPETGGRFVGTLHLNLFFDYRIVGTQSVPVASRHCDEKVWHSQAPLLPSPYQHSHSNHHHGSYGPSATAPPTCYHVHHHHYYYSVNASSGTDVGNESFTSSPIIIGETEEEERERKNGKWKKLYDGALDALQVAGFVLSLF